MEKSLRFQKQLDFLSGEIEPNKESEKFKYTTSDNEMKEICEEIGVYIKLKPSSQKSLRDLRGDFLEPV